MDVESNLPRSTETTQVGFLTGDVLNFLIQWMKCITASSTLVFHVLYSQIFGLGTVVG